MTQNTEQKVRTRDDQVDALYHVHNHYSTIPQGRFRTELEEAEARGAAEQRRKDAEFGLQPISLAKKDRTIILAKIHDDLFPRIRPERKDLEPWNGRWVVVSHPGILEDGFDLGWGVAAPVGHGGFPDDWFVGWSPIDAPANVAALEARVKELEGENEKFRNAMSAIATHIGGFASPNCSVDFMTSAVPEEVRLSCAALTREGGE